MLGLVVGWAKWAKYISSSGHSGVIMKLNWIRLIARFNRAYREQGFPCHGSFQQNIGWYLHCCPEDKQTKTLSFLANLYRNRLQDSKERFYSQAA
jgi:hypothetical protein